MEGEGEVKRLGELFQIEGEDEVPYILRNSVVRNWKERLLTIGQHAFISSVLKRFDVEDCKPVVTLIESGAKFEKLNNDEVVVKLIEF